MNIAYLSINYANINQFKMDNPSMDLIVQQPYIFESGESLEYAISLFSKLNQFLKRPNITLYVDDKRESEDNYIAYHIGDKNLGTEYADFSLFYHFSACGKIRSNISLRKRGNIYRDNLWEYNPNLFEQLILMEDSYLGIGIVKFDRLAECKSCKYFANLNYLHCAVDPFYTVSNAIDCKDFSPNIRP